MENVLVSVVIPAYNCADTIAQAINSALRQHVPMQIIVVNDCSGDALDEVMAEYAGDERIVYVKNPKNLGAAGSRNKAVALAKGRYVAFLDGDDLWRDGKILRQIELLERTGAALCCTARELMTPEGICTGRVIRVKEKITYRDLLKHNSISCSSVVMPTAVAREFPMHHEDSHEDYIMWLEVLQKYGWACAVTEPLLCYRLSKTGKSGSKLKSARMTFRVYRYMGFGMAKSICCFVSYAMHGVWKYARSAWSKT